VGQSFELVTPGLRCGRSNQCGETGGAPTNALSQKKKKRKSIKWSAGSQTSWQAPRVKTKESGRGGALLEFAIGKKTGEMGVYCAGRGGKGSL